MQRRRDFAPLAVAAAFISIAGGLLSLLAVGKVAYELMQIGMVVAGATFFSALVLVLNYVSQPRSAPLIQVNFNSKYLRDELEQVIDADFSEVAPVETPSWEPTPDSLVLDDPILALAKVRIDLERELRRLAAETGIIQVVHGMSLGRTLGVLEKESLVPFAVAAAIRDIMPVCNRAIHGEEVDLKTARSVVSLARQIMMFLQGKRQRQAATMDAENSTS